MEIGTERKTECYTFRSGYVPFSRSGTFRFYRTLQALIAKDSFRKTEHVTFYVPFRFRSVPFCFS